MNRCVCAVLSCITYRTIFQIFMSHREIKVRQGQNFAKIEQIFKFLCRSEIPHSQFDEAEVWSMLVHTFWYII